MNATDTHIASNPAERADASVVLPEARPRYRYASSKLLPHHLKRSAIIYVRQSTPQQVQNNTESTARQYALVDRAIDLGWARSQVEVIDDDQAISGKTVAGRLGFQRLLAEVSLDHVGIIVGLEMSRLARCCKDWHQLLELCSIFRTLLADYDGVYDPTDYNDRLLLGLKGTMSEAELHILKGRLNEGKLNKARRGDLFNHAPMGYVKLSRDKIAFDPDEQVQSVVQLMFAKFEELGSVAAVLKYFRKHDIKIGIRPHDGPNAGQLEWRRPWASTLRNYLRHPIYAGVYTYGRCQVDPRRQQAGKHGSGKREVPQEQWHAFLRDELPAYISWDQFMANQRQIDNNGTRMAAMRAPREGKSLLAGLLVCGHCGARMNVDYKDEVHGHKYLCMRQKIDHGGDMCQLFPGHFIDDFVGAQLLQVLQPDVLELSLQVADDLQKERERLDLNWRQNIERARFEARRAEKRYRAVDAENRLVARTLEQEWEQAMRQVGQVEENFERFQLECPVEFSVEDRDRIRALATDIPALWQSPTTSPVDRKQIARHVIEKIVATVLNRTEYVDVAIHWAGGFTSQHELIRPVASYKQLRDFEQMKTRTLQLADEGKSCGEIAGILNADGFRPPRNRFTFNKISVQSLLRLLDRRSPCTWGRTELKLQADEWLVTGLAKELQIPQSTVHSWIKHGWVHAKQEANRFKRWIVWADADEVSRLRRLHSCPRQNNLHHPFPVELTTPKQRPIPQKSSDAD